MSVEGRAIWVMQGGGSGGPRPAMRAAAQHLGFRRTGKRIQAAFKSAITGLLRQHRLEHDGNQIRRPQ